MITKLPTSKAVSPINIGESTVTGSSNSETGIYSHQGYIQACQWFFLVTGRLVWRILGRNVKIDMKSTDIEPGMRYVLAANHQTYLDPWLVPSSLPYSYWRKMGTLRAFVANRFFGYFFVGNMLRSLGSFPAKEHPTDPYGLDYAIALMARGNSIGIFPEGGLSKNREKPARRGVMVLAQQPNVRIIPVHIEWKSMDKLSTFDMGIGKPFDASKMTAEEILERIYAQPVN